MSVDPSPPRAAPLLECFQLLDQSALGSEVRGRSDRAIVVIDPPHARCAAGMGGH